MSRYCSTVENDKIIFFSFIYVYIKDVLDLWKYSTFGFRRIIMFFDKVPNTVLSFLKISASDKKNFV